VGAPAAVLPAAASAGGAAKPETAMGASAVFQEDNGTLDLSKCQMLAWTFIAIVIYLVGVDTLLPKIAAGAVTQLGLPDIDASLMVLMGLGHGAYLGKKLVTTNTPRLTGLAPSPAKGGDIVTLLGVALGGPTNYSLITLDNQPIDSGAATSWTDTQIQFKLPTKAPDGTDWSAAGRTVPVAVIVGGQPTNPLPVTVAAGEGQRAAVPTRG
jgi:hypothetical protein